MATPTKRARREKQPAGICGAATSSAPCSPQSGTTKWRRRSPRETNRRSETPAGRLLGSGLRPQQYPSSSADKRNTRASCESGREWQRRAHRHSVRAEPSCVRIQADWYCRWLESDSLLSRKLRKSPRWSPSFQLECLFVLGIIPKSIQLPTRLATAQTSAHQDAPVIDWRGCCTTGWSEMLRCWFVS